MKRNAYRIFLALTTLEGVVALFFLLRITSMDRNAQIMGYSLRRLGVAFIALIIVLFFAYLTIRAFFDERWLDRLRHWLETKLVPGDRLLVVTFTLTAVAFGGILLVFIWNLTIYPVQFKEIGSLIKPVKVSCDSGSSMD